MREEPATPIEREVLARIRRRGPLPFSEVMDLALYDPVHGFYAAGGQAGRRGDFLTSPEVGPLFGAVLARFLDERWHELGEPDPFLVVEAGAGTGTLARTIRAAQPACLGALTYLLVEQSAALRERHGEHLEIVPPAFALPAGLDGDDDGVRAERGSGPRFASLGELPAISFAGVVIANELLDNLPFDLLVHHGDEWQEVRVGCDDDGSPVEFVVPAADAMVQRARRLVPQASEGARLPIQHGACAWIARVLERLTGGVLIVIDYAADSPVLADRPSDEWLRTYRAHGRGGHPLEALGHQDITVEVAGDQLALVQRPTAVAAQTDFLRRHGIDELVEEGRRIWHERAAIGDLEAIKARSRVREADALLDEAGLGAFCVFEWRI